MFKIVTNVEHWHNLYESKNCTEAFKRSSIGGGTAAKYLSSVLARASRETSQREDVLVLVSDDQKELWSLEAILRTKFTGNIGDVLSESSEVRQKAIGELVHIITDLDRSVDEVKKKTEKKAPGIIPVSVAGVGAVAVLNFVLWMDTSSRHDDVIVAMDGVKGNTMAETEQKIAALATEFNEKLEKLDHSVDGHQGRLEDDVKRAEAEIEELERKIPKLENKYDDVRQMFEVFKDEVNNSLTGLEEADRQASEGLSKLEAGLEGIKKLAGNGVDDDNKFQKLGTAVDSIPIEEGTVEDRQIVKVKFVQKYLAFGGYLGEEEVDGKLGENTWGAYNRWRGRICRGRVSELEVDSISVDEAISMILYVHIGTERSILRIYCW